MSSSPWLARVDPPTRIREAPHETADDAVSAACLGVKSSGSSKAAMIGPFLVLFRMYFSTGPDSINSGPGFGVIVDECVVDVDVGPFGGIPHFSASV